MLQLHAGTTHYSRIQDNLQPSYTYSCTTLRGLLIQMQNISLRSLGMHRKQNFEIALAFKSDTVVLTFTFHFLSSPLFLLFLPHFLVGFSLVGKVFKKAFRILGLDKRKGTCTCRWVVEQDFHGNFQVNVTFFFLFLRCGFTWAIRLAKG